MGKELNVLPEVARVKVLMDSINAIDQALLKELKDPNTFILKINIDYIQKQLAKKIYQDALTQEQKDSLLDAITRANVALDSILP